MDYPFGEIIKTVENGPVISRNPCSSGLSFRRWHNTDIMRSVFCNCRNPCSSGLSFRRKNEIINMSQHDKVAILVLVDYPFGDIYPASNFVITILCRNPCSSGLSFRSYLLTWKDIWLSSRRNPCSSGLSFRRIWFTKENSSVWEMVAILVLVDYPFGASERWRLLWTWLVSQSLF